uniref:Immunoglobulin-like and fibronectin type III domain-containing protein 1 n=1 Tax=Stegastes partitus TaxID=144197 RepID=A0A3B5BHS9_9TELE
LVVKEKSLLPKAAKRRSKTPGVMITQYVVNLPEGKTTPDFKSKPAPITINEGKLAVFKALVTGDPKPEVSWRRAKGLILDKEKFQSKYDKSTGEYILEIHKVSGAETDTYKCHAVNEYGKAVCTTTLTVIEGKIYLSSTNPADFRKLLKKSKVERADGESDEKFWDAMLNADRKDYERICSEFALTPNALSSAKHLILSVTLLCTLQDGVIPYDEDEIQTHDLRSVGRTKDFGIKGLIQDDTDFYQGDVEEINRRNADVDFVIKIQETKVKEGEDALFECVLTHPLPKITWKGKGSTLEDGEKYSTTVSDHKLVHRLLIKDCQQLDKGIYSAVAGITSCSAWLVVEARRKGPHSKGHNKHTKFVINVPSRRDCDLRCAPTFIVPLKLHTAPKGYECYMSCAVKGNPAPRITWYRNHISLNTNTNYYISNTCGVCSMLILRVGPKDMGEYTITAENSLGRAECTTVLSVRGETETLLQLTLKGWWKMKIINCRFFSLSPLQSEETESTSVLYEQHLIER